jgi:hypothetical protein
VETGLGLDDRLGLSAEQLRGLGPEAAALGYTSVWTPSGGRDGDPVGLCVEWHAASGLRTGVSVLPIGDPAAQGVSAANAHERTGGAFVLGLGSGGIRTGALEALRSHVAAVRGAMGERRAPVYLAALGPRMLRLAGEIADGVALNWCTAAHVRWSRELVAAQIPAVSYIRMCIDDDVAAARRLLARQVLAYALGANDGYRRHFARMGFEAEIRALQRQRADGTDPDDLADGVPPRLLDAVGYAGPAAGARAALERLGAGLDIAIVRVLAAPSSLAAVSRVMRAAAPR